MVPITDQIVFRDLPKVSITDEVVLLTVSLPLKTRFGGPQGDRKVSRNEFGVGSRGWKVLKDDSGSRGRVGRGARTNDSLPGGIGRGARTNDSLSEGVGRGGPHMRLIARGA